MNILVTARMFAHLSDNPFRYFTDAGHSLIPNPYRGKGLNEEELIELIGEADALLTGVDTVTERVLEHAPRLQVISKFGTGVDNIDVAAATRRGIVVTKAPGANAEAVADMAFALMFALARQLPRAWDSVRTGGWPLIVGTEVFGKQLGLVGLGDIGRRVAERARGFQMRILACETAPNEQFVAENHIQLVGFDELLEQSDFVSIHVPLTPETKGLISTEQLSRMQPTAYLVNTARGGIVDERALFDALKSDTIAGAACDVFEAEPLRDRRLAELSNFIATPHISPFTREAIGNAERMSAQNILDVLGGNRPPYVVNPDVYVSRRCDKKGP